MRTLAEILAEQRGPVPIWFFVLNLGLAVALSFLLAYVYTRWGDSLSNRRRFAANFVLVTVTTTFIISIIQSSLALSLGLVGALSIVRFRAAIKEPEELAYLFIAISMGLGLGANQTAITLIAVAVLVLVVWLRKALRKRQPGVNLHVSISNHDLPKVSLEQLVETLRPHCAELVMVRFVDF
jgi:4-amino-4-deoxy-L-arabinose transferase-like glycosyltransferase